jgi:predicted phage tail protein
MKTDEFAERLKGLSQDELKGMLDAGLKEYTEEALAGARAELERRGRDGVAKPAAPAVPEVATTAPVPANTARPSRWGGVLIVLGGFFIYATTLFGVLAVVRSNLKLRVETQQIFQVLIYAVIAFVCLRAGSRRKKNWQTILGVSLLVLAGLAFVSLSNISAQRPGTLMGKVIVPTVVIMAVLGGVSLLAAHIKKSYSK